MALEALILTSESERPSPWRTVPSSSLGLLCCEGRAVTTLRNTTLSSPSGLMGIWSNIISHCLIDIDKNITYSVLALPHHSLLEC